MFRRIFQDYKGFIKELIGLRVSSLKVIVNQDNADLLLLWIGVNNNSDWYRIFIDGYYCGIDNYKQDLFNEDIDDELMCLENDYVNKEIIKHAKVESGDGVNYSILLTIEFESGKKLGLYCHGKSGICELKTKFR